MKQISEKTICDAKVFKVSEVKLKKGEKTVIHSVVRFPGTVCVLPVTSEGKIILERQYRSPIGGYLIEIPAGKIDQGEKPEKCMVRELEEETGYRAVKFKKVYEAYTSCGCLDEYLHYYIASVEKIAENDRTLFPDQNEDIEVFEVDVVEAVRMIRDNEIVDAKTILMITNYFGGLIGFEE
jgi:ADP-ribose pyrophosphatase